MNSRPMLSSVCACISVIALSGAPASSPIQRHADGVSVNVNGGVLRLQVFAPRIIRVVYLPTGTTPKSQSFSVISKPAKVSWKLNASSEEMRLATDSVEVRFNRGSETLEFLDRSGHLILREGVRSLRPTHVANIATLESRQDFVLLPDEAIYGLGQHQDGAMNYRGRIVHLQQENTKIAIPVIVSTHGYGLLWDNPAVTDVNVSAGEPQAVPATMLFTQDEGRGGLTVHYYRGENFGDLIFTAPDPVANFSGSNAWPANLPQEPLSVRYRGYLIPDVEGDYTFFAAAEGGMRLRVDDELLADTITTRSGELRTVRIHLEAHRRRKLEFEYVQDTSPTKIQLQWSLPQPVPTLSWRSEAADAIDYYFLYGPELDQVIDGYRHLTRPAPLFPKWMWGLWQSRERYRSQQELIDVVQEYRRLHIPLDVIVQDWHYWDPAPWGSHSFDPERYPDPGKMVQDLHALHAHVAISAWARFDPAAKNAEELQRANGLYAPSYLIDFIGKPHKIYDAFSPNARHIYWRQISRQIFRFGFDGWWLDSSEPNLANKWENFVR